MIRILENLKMGLALLFTGSAFIFTACWLGTSQALAWTAGDVSTFQQANQEYRAGHFNKAADLYKELLETYPRLAVVYYNLGNSYFREGKLGEAILAYERARYYEPRDEDIQFNLNYARGLLEYRVEDKRNWYIRAGEQFLENFTEEEIDLIWLGAFFLFILSWCFMLFFRRGTPWGWRRKFLLWLSVLFFILSIAKEVETRMIRDAIVMAKGTDVRYGPTESDQVAFRLGEGIKVYVVDQR
ncbi:MAG TPA: tetratricopeptide repeat protein, partial [bacterium]|nr:tetratricopeptide repeat protein [bacterium]